jgi:hypothetical protein
MISIQKVIFPGIAAGCLFLVFVTSMIAKPTIALAAGSAAGGAEAKVAEERARAAAVAVAAGKHTVNKSLPAQSATAATSKASSGDENASSQDQPPSQAGEQQNGTKEAPCSLSLSYPDSIRQWWGRSSGMQSKTVWSPICWQPSCCRRAVETRKLTPKAVQ